MLDNKLYPYDDVITDDGHLWAISKHNGQYQAIVIFDDVSSRFTESISDGEIIFVMRSRLCQLGLNSSVISIEKASYNKNKLECTILFDFVKNSEIALRTLDYILTSRAKIAIGKLYIRQEHRKLKYEDILRNIYSSGEALIEAEKIQDYGKEQVIIPMDPVIFNYGPDNLPNKDQIYNLLSQGTRRDLDFFRTQKRMSLPHNIKPNTWILTQLPLFRLREHFAIIDAITYKNKIVDSIYHASARLFDPLSYKVIHTRPMVEVFNNSDKPARFDGVLMSFYRPAKSRCSIQVPIDLRFSELFRSSGELLKQMDTSLKGNIIAHGKKIKHAAFIVDHTDLENLESLKNSTVSPMKNIKLNDSPEYEILDEISRGFIKADGFLLNYYFPRWDISAKIELCKDKIYALIFREPSQTNNPFFSEFDVIELKRLKKLGIRIIWLKDNGIYEYFTRDDCGFFMKEEHLQRFNFATFFSCYGSASHVDESLTKQLSSFFHDLSLLFGDIGVVTGGGPGLMEVINKTAIESNILSASCCLSTEFSKIPQQINHYHNIFMYFDEDCRHTRQKNFSIARFPLFFPGGVGTLEEVGIELCSLKLGVRENAPYIFVDSKYWAAFSDFIKTALKKKMLTQSVAKNIFFVDTLDEALEIYRKFLQNPNKLFEENIIKDK